jgi:hypothetical protein
MTRQCHLSGVRSSITKIAVAGVLIAIPTAGVSVPVHVHATPGFGGASNTLAPYGLHPAQPPAAPSTDAPEPPPPPPPPPRPPAQPPSGGYDWWTYGTDGGGGGGGGG